MAEVLTCICKDVPHFYSQCPVHQRLEEFKLVGISPIDPDKLLDKNCRVYDVTAVDPGGEDHLFRNET